jgi:hypothetical protein
MAMPPGRVLDFVGERSAWSQLSHASAKYWRAGAAIRVREDGIWELDPGHDAVRSARQAVLDRVAMSRRGGAARPDPAAVEVSLRRAEALREAAAERLARLRRVLVHAFPAASPEAVVLIDVGRHEITTLVGGDVAKARDGLADFDLIAAVDVRGVLRGLGVEPDGRRLAELGPPQKTRKLNRAGRTLRITTSLLIRGSCGISHPLAAETVLRRYLRDGKLAQLRRRLEADAKSIHALYQYGRLHGRVRLRWGFLDEMIAAPWVHPDEPRLYTLMQRAQAQGLPLEVVVGNAPGWADPWSRARRAHVAGGDERWRLWLVDDQGSVIDEGLIQLARIAASESKRAR